MAKPSYIKMYKDGHLSERVQRARALLEDCRLCPRECGVNRSKNEKGICRTGARARIASYNAHFGEEEPLVGKYGSGTIFFSFCNLRCSFCQNYEISNIGEGSELDAKELADIMLALEQRGCHNVNLVTPTHVVPQILESLLLAAEKGLSIPIVYNTGGYEKKETLELLKGIVDIYMPDFKFWDNRWSERYCNASDYRERAIGGIKEMHDQVGDLKINEEGIAEKGLLVRHLVMPNNVSGTREIMDFIAGNISRDTYVNIMDQYRPCGMAYKDEYINRRVDSKEFSIALESAEEAGLQRLDQRRGFRILFGL